MRNGIEAFPQAVGQMAAAVPSATRQVPIASVARLMTAYVILQDHPLSGGGSGPDITVEQSEAAAYPSQARDPARVRNRSFTGDGPPALPAYQARPEQ